METAVGETLLPFRFSCRGRSMARAALAAFLACLVLAFAGMGARDTFRAMREPSQWQRAAMAQDAGAYFLAALLACIFLIVRLT